MFILTVIIGYGIGSWVLLGYTERVSKEIRAKSRFINSIHWTVMIIQFSLFVILLFVLFSNIVLLYGIAAVTLAMSIAEDAGTKLLMIHLVQEKSPAGAITKSSFMYKPSKKYNEIEYKVVNPQTTILYLLPALPSL